MMTFFRLTGLLAAVFMILMGGTGGASAQSAGYIVRSGDTLGIEVLQDGTLNRQVLVTPDGTFSFPFVGTVQASGRTPAQISEQVAAGIASNFASPPNVFVSVVSLRPVIPQPAGPAAPERTISIYLLGEVVTPGLIAVAPGTTLLQALSQSGGFTNFAALKRLQLRRTDSNNGTQAVTLINYRAIANGAALSSDIVLRDGDVLLVPQRRLFE